MREIVPLMEAVIAEVALGEEEEAAIQFHVVGEQMEVILTEEDFDLDLDRMMGVDWLQVLIQARRRAQNMRPAPTSTGRVSIDLARQHGQIDEQGLRLLLENHREEGLILTYFSSSQMSSGARWEAMVGPHEGQRLVEGGSFQELMADYRATV